MSDQREEDLPNTFMALPRDLIREVLGKVASSSLIDLHRAKLCCREFFEVAEEEDIYKQISLDKLPLIQWHKNFQVSNFLNKCRQSRNSEALFRKGVVNYFRGKNSEDAFKYIEEAAKSGHVESLYAMAIILVFVGGESKKRGITMLSGMKKSKTLKRKVRNCRRRLQSIVKTIWVTNALILSQRPTCCGMGHKTSRRHHWTDEIEDGDDNDEVDQHANMCEGCVCHEEIKPICDALPTFVGYN